MKTLRDVQVGDEIVMVYRSGRMTNGKSDDRIRRAVVTEAKRVNLTIEECEPLALPNARKRTWKVRRDDRKMNVGYYGWHAYTTDEYEHRERTAKALEFLRKQGIRIEFNSPWCDREIELANLIIMRDVMPGDTFGPESI